MIAISQELRQAIELAGGTPVELSDPENQIAYVIVRADVYERMRASGEELEVRNLYPAMNAVSASEGWDDPSMDIYDEYDSPSQSR